jgi:formamidopyrimidine-DNA glycosylase
VPEGVEIEIYRRAAERALGRPVASVQADDAWFCKAGTTPEALVATLTGATFTTARRRGKLLLLDHDHGTLGLRFGMTGRIIVDDDAPIDALEYSSDRNDPAWDRFVLTFADGGTLRLRDPRRLGGVVLDPDENALGADAFSITSAELDRRVFVGDIALKARLLDQARVAGIGNLIADETLWRASIDPAVPAGSVDATTRRRFRRHLAAVLDDFLRDGGSHTGRLQPARHRGATCPKDGAVLDRRTIGGRTTFSCPQHQR